MKGVAIGRMSITQSKVNGNTQLNLTTAEDILQESVSLMEDEIFEASRLVAATTCQIELKCSLSELSDVTREVTEIDVFSTLLRFEKLKADLALRVLVR